VDRQILAERLRREWRASQHRLERGARLLPHRLANRLCVVCEGALAIESGRGRADAQILEVIAPVDGALCGAICGRSLVQAERELSLVALIPTTVLSLTESVSEELAAADPKLAAPVLSALLERSGDLLRRLVSREEPDVLRRVAGALCYLADRVGVSCPVASGCRIQLAQATIAATAGLSRQTANRALRQLQEWGFVRSERSMVCVLDREALRILADGGRPLHARVPVGPCKLRQPTAMLTCHLQSTTVMPALHVLGHRSSSG
jgi:hypothetical protein